MVNQYPEFRIYIDPTAIIEHGVSIGENSKIWHFCHVMKGAMIGESCILGQNVHIASNVKIGKGCKIQNNVSIYEGVELGDYVFVGPSAVFTNVLTPRAEVNRHEQYIKTVVEHGATIGANATILCGIRIGAYATIGAGSVVTNNVPAYALVYGNPARQHGTVCQCGLPIKDYCKPCPECGRFYHKNEDHKLEDIV